MLNPLVTSSCLLSMNTVKFSNLCGSRLGKFEFVLKEHMESWANYNICVRIERHDLGLETALQVVGKLQVQVQENVPEVLGLVLYALTKVDIGADEITEFIIRKLGLRTHDLTYRIRVADILLSDLKTFEKMSSKSKSFPYI